MRFVFILCFFKYFFTISVVIEKAKLKLALPISTGALIALANDAIDISPFVTDKTIKDLSG